MLYTKIENMMIMLQLGGNAWVLRLYTPHLTQILQLEFQNIYVIFVYIDFYFKSFIAFVDS